MKYSKRIVSSLMAALIACSALGTGAGAVEFTVVGDTNTGTNTTQTAVTTTVGVQIPVPEFFDGCVKFSWSAVNGATVYILKICDKDFNVISSTRISSGLTATTIPETAFNVEYNSKADFYACVVALKPGETDVIGTTYYAPASSKFTVESDMSKYPTFGAPQNVTAGVKKGTLYLAWKNPNDFATKKDLFSIDIVDSLGKSVFTKVVQDTKVEVTGLKDGQSYTAKINNKTFSAMTECRFTFTSDVKTAPNETQKEETGSSDNKVKLDKLPAPANIKAKAGDSKVSLSWDKVDGADGYRIYVYNTKTKKYETLKTVKSNKYTAKNLTNGKKYKFRIAAVTYNSKTKKYVSGTVSKTFQVTPKKSNVKTA